mmetsp:Transcript_20308/g.42272  ORF Transcript_20308/g.42272 Transcript_20308/m.42272 type:complete len:246 (+) Transcript_20308:86-823(+)
MCVCMYCFDIRSFGDGLMSAKRLHERRSPAIQQIHRCIVIVIVVVIDNPKNTLDLVFVVLGLFALFFLFGHVAIGFFFGFFVFRCRFLFVFILVVFDTERLAIKQVANHLLDIDLLSDVIAICEGGKSPKHVGCVRRSPIQHGCIRSYSGSETRKGHTNGHSDKVCEDDIKKGSEEDLYFVRQVGYARQPVLRRAQQANDQANNNRKPQDKIINDPNRPHHSSLHGFQLEQEHEQSRNDRKKKGN